MKSFSKILSVFLSLAVILTTTTAFGATTKSPFISKTYTHQSRFDDYEIANGIDISYYNGDIDFNKVKKAGVKFAIIRVGYRGYGTNGSLCNDTKFATYIKDAKAAGIKVGVYFYSQAISQREAVDEAKRVLERLGNQSLDLPIVWDIEFAGSNGTTGRLYNAKLTKTQMTNNALAFCDTIKAAGYNAMVYANASFLTNHLYPEKLQQEGYGIWLAHYTTNTNYKGDFNIWQYTSSGRVNGIDGNVDCNFMYIPPDDDFSVEDISDITYTGEEITPSISVSYKDKKLVKGKDYTLSYSSNVEIGRAKITIKGIGDYADVTKKNVYFNIVPPAAKNARLSGRGQTYLKVKWDKNPYADGYEVQIYRKEGWQNAGETENNYFTINNLTVASSYTVKIRAYKTVNNKKYYSAFSNSVKDSTKPSTVKSISYTAAPNQVTLSWSKVGNSTGYKIYKYYPSTKKTRLYKTVTSTSVKVTDLKPNSEYSFIIKAYKNSYNNTVLYGENSKVLKAYTAPSAPKATSAVSNSKKRITFKWKKVSSVSGYEIMWSTTSNFSSNRKTVTASSASTAKVIATAQSNKKYYVRIRAYKTHGNKKLYSPWSTTLSTKVK